MSTTVALTAEDEAKVEEFAGSLFMACLAAMELANVELGVRLGLYEALAGAGGMTAAELAAQAGIAERYAREWLEQQAVAGVVEVDDAAKPASERRFTLPNAHAHVLIDDDSEACMKPCAAVVPWVGEGDRHHGRGVPPRHRRGVRAVRPARHPGRVHAAGVRQPPHADVAPGADRRPGEARPPANAVRIAEVGCGEGLAAITIAKAYPNAEIDGFDLDDASIAVGVGGRCRGGCADRARFELRDAADPTIEGDYDLVMAIEMLHDVPDPVWILRTMRRSPVSAGTVLVVDERTEEQFTAPGSEMERFFYAFSTLHCLAVSMQNGGAGTGTVIRADTVRRYAADAGFSTVEVLDVDHPQFRLYRLT